MFTAVEQPLHLETYKNLASSQKNGKMAAKNKMWDRG